MEWNHVESVQEFTVEGQCSKIKVRSCRITWDTHQVPRVELTLAELQEMATRQQQQIEAQQQMLVAKEQRLRYLQQRDSKGQGGQGPSEAEKLQKLKERVESQEAKLKKIRAMRGQVDYSKLINGNLSAEIDHVSGLFQEKQVELQAAVVRVDQLTQQLDDLRKGRLNGLQPLGAPLSGSAALELRKLYQELQVRNKLNREQSTKLQQNKDLLNKKNTEVSLMDKRIGDLRERLHKKRAELSRVNGSPPSPQLLPGSSGRVAAVCPYIQVPTSVRQDRGYSPLPLDPLKPPLEFAHARSHSANEGAWPGLSKSASSSLQPSDWRNHSPDLPSDWRNPSSDQMDSSRHPVSRSPPIYGTYPSTGHALPQHLACSTSSLPRSAPSTLAWPLHRHGPPSSSSSSSSSSQLIQQRISVPPSPTPSCQSQSGERDAPMAVAVRPYVPDKTGSTGSRPQSPRKGPATMNSSSIYHMYLQQPASSKNYGSLSNRSTVKAVYGKPVLPCSSTSPSPVPFQQQGALSPGIGSGGVEEAAEPAGGGGIDLPDGSGGAHQHPPPPSVDNIPRPLSPTKLTPVAHSPLRYQSDADLEVLRRRLANAPRPLKKRSSITEPEGPQGPNIQKLLYQRFNTLAGGMEGVGVTVGGGGVGGGATTPFYQPAYLAPPTLDNAHAANGNLQETGVTATLAEVPNDNPAPSPRQSPPTLVSPSPSPLVEQQRTSPTPSVPGHTPPRVVAPPPVSEDQNNNNQVAGSSPGSSPSPVATPPPPKDSSPRNVTSSAPPKVKRTNLKKPQSERTGHGLRVKFNPLALLLDASLEGEFDLVQRIIYEVENPSTPNDEGITPLHNAVCAGHHHIVKFLLDFGVNVNAADSDGWTPLHCAASCNSVHLCKLLVESGAAIFATTISDVETAADKCEEMEDGYTQCSQFLYGVQEKLGVMNKGSVYALWSYEAQSPDELSFHEGDAITILRRCDDAETDWWWARLQEKEGYVPRNLLGLYPRIKPRQRSLA